MPVYDMNDDSKRLLTELQENQRQIGELAKALASGHPSVAGRSLAETADMLERLEARTIQITEQLRTHEIG